MAVEHPDEPDPAPTRRPWKWLSVLGSALLLAVVSAIGSGLGSEVLDLFADEEEPISSSALEQQVSECGTALFVGREQATRLVSGEIPTPTDWETFQRSNSAVVADTSVVEVSIQGESSRTVTLSGIEFAVDRQRRPAGATFSNPCGDPISGRFVVADLDREPVAVISTAQDPDAVLDAVNSSYKPIRFPWTVSITDPLLLKVVARTKRCYCTWRAEIPWRSGEQSGVILIDNDGSGYTVAGTDGAAAFSPGPSAQRPWVRLP